MPDEVCAEFLAGCFSQSLAIWMYRGAVHRVLPAQRWSPVKHITVNAIVLAALRMCENTVLKSTVPHHWEPAEP